MPDPHAPNTNLLHVFARRESLLPLAARERAPDVASFQLHTHSGYQCMLAEAIAVVCAPQATPEWVLFSRSVLRRYALSSSLSRPLASASSASRTHQASSSSCRATKQRRSIRTRSPRAASTRAASVIAIVGSGMCGVRVGLSLLRVSAWLTSASVVFFQCARVRVSRSSISGRRAGVC